MLFIFGSIGPGVHYYYHHHHHHHHLSANMQLRLTNSQRYLVEGIVGLVGLIGLGLLLTVTIRGSRVSAVVSVRVSVN